MNNGSSPQDVAKMLGNGKLDTVIPQLWQRLSNVQGDALQSAIAEFSGSYAHKSKKAEELITQVKALHHTFGKLHSLCRNLEVDSSCISVVV